MTGKCNWVYPNGQFLCSVGNFKGRSIFGSKSNLETQSSRPNCTSSQTMRGMLLNLHVDVYSQSSMVLDHELLNGVCLNHHVPCRQNGQLPGARIMWYNQPLLFPYACFVVTSNVFLKAKKCQVKRVFFNANNCFFKITNRT